MICKETWKTKHEEEYHVSVTIWLKSLFGTMNYQPFGDKSCRNEHNSTNSVSIGNKDMVAHAP